MTCKRQCGPSPSWLTAEEEGDTTNEQDEERNDTCPNNAEHHWARVGVAAVPYHKGKSRETQVRFQTDNHVLPPTPFCCGYAVHALSVHPSSKLSSEINSCRRRQAEYTAAG